MKIRKLQLIWFKSRNKDKENDKYINPLMPNDL
jgi:hypothetical protein